MIEVLGGAVSFEGKIKTAGDVFSSTEEHEKRLVEQGFAKFVNVKEEPKMEENKPKVDELGNGEKQVKEEHKEEKAEFDENKAKRLNVDNLKDLAVSYGVNEEELLQEDGSNKTKNEIIELIKAAIEAEKCDDNFDELGNGEDGIA